MTPLDWFPTVGGAWQVPAEERAVPPGQLNLKSCELLQPRVLDWHADRLAQLHGADTVAYPTTGVTRDLLARHWAVDRSEVLLTPGTEHAIRLVCEGLCAPAGRLVIADPHFESWSLSASLYGFRLDSVPAPAGGPVPVGALVDRMRAGDRAVVVLTQPDSINGHLYTADETEQLVDVAARHGSLLVIDTCYLAFAENGERTVSPFRGRHVLRINSFSKSLGLAGARIGAMAGAPALIDYLSRWRADRMIAGTSLQLLRLALADLPVFEAAWAEVRLARAALAVRLPEILPSLRPRPSGANFVAFDGPAAQAAELHATLLAAGIRTRLLTGVAGFPGGIRVATPATAAVDQVLAALPVGAADAPTDSRETEAAPA